MSCFPLNDSILLRCVGGKEFMLDSFFIALLIHLVVLEFGAIVTQDLHNVKPELSLGSLGESLEHVRSFSLIT